jgi:ABC-type sugar transport system permease subunit
MIVRFRWLEPYLWVLPAVAFFVAFIAYPVYFSFYLSFHEWSGWTPIETMEWVGLANYRELLTDKIFHFTLRNTVFYALVTTAAFSVLAFLLAFALWYKAPRAAGFFRSLIFYPSILSTVIIALAWFRMYAMDGMVNGIISGITGRESSIMWLSNPKLAIWSVMWVDVWKHTGWTMVLFLAAMSAVPRELTESAVLDGASSLQMVRYIVLPMIRNISSLTVLLNIVGGLKVFGPVWVMTQGGPLHRTEVLATYSYWLAFSMRGPNRLSYAAAVTSVGVIILFALSVVRLRVSRTG